MPGKYCFEINGTEICVPVYVERRKFHWEPDPDPRLDLRRVFEDVVQPVVTVNGEVARFHQDLVRLTAIQDIVATIADVEVRNALAGNIDDLSQKVLDAGLPEQGARMERVG